MTPREAPVGAPGIASGTRVKVKFNDASEEGFAWYCGTVLGPKAGSKYRIDYDDDDEVSSLDVQDEEFVIVPGEPTKASRPPKPCKRDPAKSTRLAQLLSRLPSETRQRAEADHWCDAKVMAWLEREVNPNAFFYRFLPEGEAPRTGPWSEEELATLRRVCLERKVNTLGSRPEWGIISQHFPGRVGYACSAAYRKFVDQGEIQDPNYAFVAGRSKFIFSHSRTTSTEPGEPGQPVQGGRRAKAAALPAQDPSGCSTRRKGKRKRRVRADRGEERIYADDISTSSEDDVKHFTNSSTIDWVTADAPEDCEFNPLPNYLDQITGDLIKQPCISPQGYVAGRRSWIAALERRAGRCPFTNVKISHRHLTLLTIDNIEDHRDQVRNWDGDREVALSSDPSLRVAEEPEPPPQACAS